MTWLFDVNVLLAIADSGHVFHKAARNWLDIHIGDSWATCPLTENGFVRVISHPSYRSGALLPVEAIAFLRRMKQSREWAHVFWPDNISLTDAQLLAGERIAGSRQITDIYLAGLASRNGGRLVTFDSGVAWQAVRNASADLLEIPISR